MCTINKKKLCIDINCIICFNKSFASHPKSLFWSNKNDIQSRNLNKASRIKMIFNCNICNHEFNSSLADINNSNSWCPYCSNNKLCLDENCLYCFNKSFANSKKAIYWSNKNLIMPRNVAISSHKKYIFNCNICNHEFNTTLNYIYKNNWCPYCSQKSGKLCLDDNCLYCFNRSFASSKRANCWSNKNLINPRNVYINLVKKFIFNCNVCNHEFVSSLNHISLSNSWCPYCPQNSGKLCLDENCQYCFNKSFANSNKIKFWSAKNKINPRNITLHNSKKCWFICNKNHQFEITLYSISKGHWCQQCIISNFSKSQIQWLEFLEKYNNIYIQHALNEGEYMIKNTRWKADGYCKETNTIYEFHGDYWHGNPNMYNPNDINVTSIKTFGELYNNTIIRENKIKELGYNLEVMWESKWNKINKSIKKLQRKFKLLQKKNKLKCVIYN
jgi:hypothetical protein